MANIDKVVQTTRYVKDGKSGQETIVETKIVETKIRSDYSIDNQKDFSDKFRPVLDEIYVKRGDLKLIERDNFVSLFIEFIERGKVICRLKGLDFHEKILDTIKQALDREKKINILQLAVSLSSDDLKELNYDEAIQHFYSIKSNLMKEYSDW